MTATLIQRPGGPLRQIIYELERGTPTVDWIVRNTGLDAQVVRAGIDHLIRSGRVETRELAIGCPPVGCGGCAMAAPEGGPGCGLPSANSGRSAGVATLRLVGSR